MILKLTPAWMVGVLTCLVLAGAQPAACSLLFVGDGSLSGVVTFNVTGGIATLIGSSVPPFGTLDTPSPMQPQGMAIGPDGSLWVADSNNGQVDRFDGTTGQFIGVRISTHLSSPTGLAFGPDGTLYVADDAPIGPLGPFGSVKKFDTSGNFLGYFLAPQAPSPGNLTDFLTPNGLVFGPDGALYVADSGSGAVLRIPSFNVVSMFTPPTVTPNNSPMSNPYQPVFGPDGNLYVADTTGNVVYEFDGTTGALIKVIGQNIVGNVIVGTLLAQPTGAGFSGGNLYVGDNQARLATFDSGGNELADLLSYPTDGLISPTYVLFTSDVPEPSTLAFLGLGMLLIGALCKWGRAGRHLRQG